MKKIRSICITLAACLLLNAAGFAAEMVEEETELPEEAATEALPEEETAEVPPEIIVFECDPMEWIEEVSGPMETVTLFDAQWQDGWTCYGDQLTGVAKEYYNNMVSQFKDKKVDYQLDKNGKHVAMFNYDVEITVTKSTANEVFDEMDKKIGELKKTADELLCAAYAFTYDHPEYFWIRTDFSYGHGARVKEYSATSTGGGQWTATVPAYASVSFKVQSGYTTEEQRTAIAAEVDTAASNILSGCKNLSTVAQLAYFDNWLAENNAYNYDALKDKEESPIPRNVTGALLEGNNPVCEGYAKAFQLLCHKINIPCITVSSENHMWNMVQVDKKWYYMDCTWNDPTAGGAGGTSYTYSTREYFLLAKIEEDASSGGNGESHTISQNLAYPQTASSNYFTSTGWAEAGNGISGCVSSTLGNGNYWTALYNRSKKLLGISPCESIPWGASQTRILVPDFPSGVASQAQSGKVFVIEDETSWKPAEAAKEFFKAG